MIKGVVIVFAIATFNFFLIRLAPGDTVDAMAGEAGAADQLFVEQLREHFGLNKPIIEQLYIYLSNVLTFDLGFSYRQQRPVVDLLLERLPATLLLTSAAYSFALLLGVTLGVVAAKRVGRTTDTLITVAALAFYATPTFWIALMAVLLFSVILGWFPPYGMETIGAQLSGVSRVADVFHHLTLPAVTLGLFYVATYARLTRASMLEVQHQDYVRTARAKGLPEGRITRAHVLRNAVLPVITIAGIQAGHLVGGAILIETVFSWPGIGRLAFETLFQRDYNTLLGIFFVTSVMVVIVNLITDLLYTVVDPRIEIER
jgi:peptide/nickel transport system permease protein